MLSPEELRRIRDWIASGMTDEQIADALMVSVKVIRPVRRELELAARPRRR